MNPIIKIICHGLQAVDPKTKVQALAKIRGREKAKRLFIQLSLITCIVGIPGNTRAQNIDGKGGTQIPEMERQAYVSTKRAASTTGDNYDLKYIRAEWTVDPAVNYISGCITSHFIPVQASISTIAFDLTQALGVDSVLYHGVKLGFNHSGKVLLITLSAPVNMGILDSVSVFYKGTPVSTGNGSFVAGTHNGTPILWTLSQPNGARDWWPCKQNLNDKIDSIDIIVTCPKAYRTASNGLLISETISGANTICHWKSRYPIAAYLIAIGVTNYEIHKDKMRLNNGDSLSLLDYIYPESASGLQALKEIHKIIHLYDSLLITYPFSKEKYGHAQFGWNGGMEHQTMSFVGGFNFDLLSHECAHQWFGDRVTCASWKDIWLNEGFTSYLELVSYEKLLPPSYSLEWKQSAKSYITSLYNGSVYCPDTINDTRIFDVRLTYRKAAFMLHMLRWKIGDSAFFAACRNYLNDPALAYGYARSSHAIDHFEAASGKDLTGFFADWLYGEGYPTYNVQVTYNFGQVNVKMNQSVSHPSVPFYEMPVPIRFMSATHDTTIVFDHTFSGQTFTAHIPFRPTFVSFDPEVHLLSGNNTMTVNILGLEQLNTNSPGLQAWPNPTDQVLNISGSFAAGAGSIRLVNLLGETVLKNDYEFSNGMSSLELDLSALSPGIYIVELRDATGVRVEKVSKR